MKKRGLFTHLGFPFYERGDLCFQPQRHVVHVVYFVAGSDGSRKSFWSGADADWRGIIQQYQRPNKNTADNQLGTFQNSHNHF